MGNARPAQSKPSLRIAEVQELGFSSREVIAFLKHKWVRPTCYTELPFYEWQFKYNQDGSGQDHNIVTVDGNGVLLGFLGVSRRIFLLRGREVEGAYFTTGVIDQKVGGLGAIGMSNYVKKYHVSVAANLSEAAKVPILSAAIGKARYLRYLPRYVRIFNLDAIRDISKISAFGERKIHLTNRRDYGNYKACEANDEDWMRAADELHKDFNCFKRDLTFMKWRYRDHPIFNYECLRIQVADRILIIVLRIDEIDGLKLCHIVDFFGNEEVYAEGIKFIECYLRDHKIDLADFYCTSDKIGRVFWMGGWLSSVDDYFIQIPHLFYPVEMCSPPTSSLTIASDTYLYELLDLSTLYLTKADCDLDKPTPYYLEQKGITL